VKNPLTGFICTCLLLAAGTLSGYAQEKRPDQQQQPADQAAPMAIAQQQPAAPADATVPAPQPQNSPDPASLATPAPLDRTAAPPQAPPAIAQQQPAAPADATVPAPQPQNSPDPASPATPAPVDRTAAPLNPAPQQAPPAGQTPPQQTPPPSEDQPSPHGILPQPPPPPPKIPDVRRPGESGFWVGLSGWFPREQPIFNRGNQLAASTDSSLITMQGKPKYAANLEVGAAVGLHNTLKFSYTTFRSSGDYTTPVDIVAWAQVYTANTYLSTSYRVQNAKLSYEYLTWPYPVGSRKFRLKTLWQVQFTAVNTVFDAPLNYYDSNGNQLIDSTTGQPINLSASRYRYIISPMLGLGTYYYPSRHFRIEANATGFGFPHKYTIYDADASINLRLVPHFELRLGARVFGFKTSTDAQYYIRGTFASAFFGVRWYSNSE